MNVKCKAGVLADSNHFFVGDSSFIIVVSV